VATFPRAAWTTGSEGPRGTMATAPLAPSDIGPQGGHEGPMEIMIRRVGMEDHINIVKLFQSFDHEKYKFIQIPELQNNNHPRGPNNRSSNKTSLSLAGLRIDERGGIYLNPLLDSHSAYFKCYVAEELNTGDLIGYILFFNTLDETRTASTGGHDDPVAVLEDLFVKPRYRGRGIATQLWRKVLKSSLDRGCFSCECLLIPENQSGLQFWKSRVGSEKIDLLLQTQAQTQNQHRREILIELSKNEMKTYYRETSVGHASSEED